MSATNQPLPSRFGVARTHTRTRTRKKPSPARPAIFWAQKHKFSTQNSRRQNALKQSQCRQGSVEDIEKGTRQRDTQRERQGERERHTVPAIPENRSTSSSSSPSSSSSSSSAVSQTRPDQSRPNDYPSDTAESCPAAFDCSSVVSFKRNTNAFGRRPAQIHKPNKISTNFTRE